MIYLRSSAHGEVAWFHISGGNNIRIVIKVDVTIIVMLVTIHLHFFLIFFIDVYGLPV